MVLDSISMGKSLDWLVQKNSVTTRCQITNKIMEWQLLTYTIPIRPCQSINQKRGHIREGLQPRLIENSALLGIISYMT